MPIADPVVQQRALDACYGDGKASGWPTTVYIGFLNGDPRSGGVEPSAGGYARIAVANTTAVWSNATVVSGAAQKTNAIDLVSAPSTASWGTNCTWFAIYDAATGGHAGDCGQLGATLTVPQSNYTARFQAGQLIITVT